MKPRRQLGWLCIAALSFHLLMLAGCLWAREVQGKSILSQFCVVIAMIGPVFFAYLPVRFLITCRAFLRERLRTRIPSFLFSMSPLVWSAMLYVIAF
jgi:hypothetical protein